MTVCTIEYASTGSDTAASGCNAPTAAITGTNGDMTGTPGTLTLNETVDFTAGSGVNDDGTDVLWVNTPTGERHLFRINSYTGGVATCTAVVCFEAASATRTADSWAVGGQRLTLNNDAVVAGRADLDDAQDGWEYVLTTSTTFTAANGALPYVINAGVIGAAGPVILRAASGISPTITWVGDSPSNVDLFQLSASTHFSVDGITFTETGAWVGSDTFNPTGANCVLRVNNCTISCSGHAFQCTQSPTFVIATNCDITANRGFNLTGRQFIQVLGCVIHNCANDGIDCDSGMTALSGSVFMGNVFRDNAVGITLDANIAGQMFCIASNVFHDNTGSGIVSSGTWSTTFGGVSILNNIFTENGAYGIAFGSAGSDAHVFEDFNAFRGNTSGETNNLDTQGANDVTLTADPYTAVGSDDYSLNATAGGGADCRDAGFGRTS